MSTSEESALTEVGEAAASIRVHVGGDWTVVDLERFLSATRQIYNAGLAAYLASSGEAETFRSQVEEFEHQAIRVEHEPLSFGEPMRLGSGGSSYEPAEAVSAEIQRVAPSVRSEPLLRALAVAREAKTFRLQLLQRDALALAPEAQLGIASISMASPGWIDLKGLGEPIKQLGKLLERLVRLPGKVKDDKLDREAKKQTNETEAARDEIEIARTKMAAIEDFLRLQWGPDFRSVPGVNEQIQELFSGVRSISDLAQSGHLLPAPDHP